MTVYCTYNVSEREEVMVNLAHTALWRVLSLDHLMSHYPQNISCRLWKCWNHKMMAWLLTCAPRLSDMMVSSKAEWVSTWGGIPVKKYYKHVELKHFDWEYEYLVSTCWQSLWWIHWIFFDVWNKFDFRCLTVKNKSLITRSFIKILISALKMHESFCCHLVVQDNKPPNECTFSPFSFTVFYLTYSPHTV